MSAHNSEEQSYFRVEVDRDIYNQLTKTIPWGLRAPLFRLVTKLILESVDQYGPAVIGAIAAGAVKLAPTADAIKGEWSDAID